MAKVLLIDDDESVRASVSRILASGGHEAVVAVNGLDGIDALIRTRFDLVITDIVMPVQDGIETIERVRELDPEIPIIAISGAFGRSHFSALEDAKLIGANLAIEKPFTVQELLEGIARVLGSHPA